MKFKTTPAERFELLEEGFEWDRDALQRFAGQLVDDLDAAQAQIAELKRDLATNQQLRIDLSERMEKAERERDEARKALREIEDREVRYNRRHDWVARTCRDALAASRAEEKPGA